MIHLICSPGWNQSPWSGKRGEYSLGAKSQEAKSLFFPSLCSTSAFPFLPLAGSDSFLPSQASRLSLGSSVTCNEHLQGRSSLVQVSQHHTWSQLGALELCPSSPAQKATTCTLSRIFWELCYSDSGMRRRQIVPWEISYWLVLDISNRAKWTTTFCMHGPSMVLFMHTEDHDRSYGPVGKHCWLHLLCRWLSGPSLSWLSHRETLTWENVTQKTSGKMTFHSEAGWGSARTSHFLELLFHFVATKVGARTGCHHVGLHRPRCAHTHP